MYRLLGFKGKTTGFKEIHSPGKGNLYTVIIGENGTGKSRMLGEIAYSALIRSDPEAASLSERPSVVLAVSNMVTDNFPYSQRIRENYRYLGLRQASNNISTGSLESSLGHFLLELRSSAQSDMDLKPLLTELGRAGYLTTVQRRSTTLDSVDIVKKIEYQIRRNGLSNLEIDPLTVHKEIRKSMSIMSKGLHRVDRNMYIMNDIMAGREISRIQRMTSIPSYAVISLVSSAYNLRFGMSFEMEFNSKAMMGRLSAGQAMLLSMVLRILSTVRPNSLILIDEPETGLHPGWQSGFLRLLRTLIPDSLGCHIFIATHSPYLVGEADNVLVPSGGGSFEEVEINQRGMTIEDILYRVFKTKVMGNTKVESDLSLLIDWLSGAHETPDVAEVKRAYFGLSGLADSETVTINTILAEVRQRIDGVNS